MLYLKNIKKYYNNKVKAVDIEELFIEKAHIACLIGPSGSGKTTLLKIINRLIEPSEGFLEINKVKSTELSPISWRRKIGYVIQNIGLFPHLTVKENICLLSRVLKQSPSFINSRTEELLDMVGLKPSQYQNRYPIELSGGQQQRVGIARALMENPPLILMDEAFRALDPITCSALRKEVLNLNQKLKKTIVLVTHDINEALEMGDLIILLRKGTIQQIGTKDDLKNNPSNAFVESFISE